MFGKRSKQETKNQGIEQGTENQGSGGNQNMTGNQNTTGSQNMTGDQSAGGDQNTTAASAAGQKSAAPAFRGKKKSKKKKIIIGVVVIVIVFGAVKMFTGGEEPVMPTATGSAERMDVSQIISIKGTVEGKDRAEITSALDREIVSIAVKEGDVVTKGQLLATLKEKDDVTDKTQKYEIQQAQNNLESAKFDYETNKKLYDEGAISYQELEKSQTAYENAQSALASARTDRSVSEDLTITSPISGVVTRVNAKVGFTASQMQSGTALFVVEDLSSLKMKVKASEYDISKIKLGQTVSISAEVLGSNLAAGTVSHIAPTGEQKESGKEMVIPVEIDITPVEGLIAGVTAKADILVAESKNALAVPLEAILTDPATGEDYVFTVDKNNTLKKQVIETGIEGDFYVEVISDGLKEGDIIVLTPDETMVEGQTIVPQGAGAGSSGTEDSGDDASVAVAM